MLTSTPKIVPISARKIVSIILSQCCDFGTAVSVNVSLKRRLPTACALVAESSTPAGDLAGSSGATRPVVKLPAPSTWMTRRFG